MSGLWKRLCVINAYVFIWIVFPIYYVGCQCDSIMRYDSVKEAWKEFNRFQIEAWKDE